jgi:hypothetical protein
MLENYCCFPLFSAIWIGESSLEAMLAVGRVMELICPKSFTNALFGGMRAWLWMGVPTGLALYVWLTQRAPVFNALLFSFLFDPYIGYAQPSAEVVHTNLN